MSPALLGVPAMFTLHEKEDNLEVFWRSLRRGVKAQEDLSCHSIRSQESFMPTEPLLEPQSQVPPPR